MRLFHEICFEYHKTQRPHFALFVFCYKVSRELNQLLEECHINCAIWKGLFHWAALTWEVNPIYFSKGFSNSVSMGARHTVVRPAERDCGIESRAEEAVWAFLLCQLHSFESQSLSEFCELLEERDDKAVLASDYEKFTKQ